MIIDDFYGTRSTQDPAELAAVFSARDQRGLNCFWLRHEAANTPCLAVLVHGDCAHITYFPTADHPGFVSQSGQSASDDGVEFSVSAIDDADILLPASAVVSAKTALCVCEEFFLSTEMPRTMRWLEL